MIKIICLNMSEFLLKWIQYFGTKKSKVFPHKNSNSAGVKIGLKSRVFIIKFKFLYMICFYSSLQKFNILGHKNSKFCLKNQNLTQNYNFRAFGVEVISSSKKVPNPSNFPSILISLSQSRVFPATLILIIPSPPPPIYTIPLSHNDDDNDDACTTLPAWVLKNSSQ